MGMTANWEQPDEKIPTNYTEEPTLATVTDIDDYRSMPVPRAYIGVSVVLPIYEEPAEPQDPRDNEINDYTLQRDTRIKPGSSGSKNKHAIEAKPLTGPERIARRIQAGLWLSALNNLPETESQRAERLLREANKKTEQAERRRGRPRKGAEVRVPISARVNPQTREIMDHIDIGPMLDEIAANMLADPETVAILTAARIRGTLAA